MGADFCDSTCLGVRCDELDTHTRIAGKATHWSAIAHGIFAIWYDGDSEPHHYDGPVAEALLWLGEYLRVIGEAWEARARVSIPTVASAKPSSIYDPYAYPYDLGDRLVPDR